MDNTSDTRFHASTHDSLLQLYGSPSHEEIEHLLFWKGMPSSGGHLFWPGDNNARREAVHVWKRHKYYIVIRLLKRVPLGMTCVNLCGVVACVESSHWVIEDIPFGMVLMDSRKIGLKTLLGVAPAPVLRSGPCYICGATKISPCLDVPHVFPKPEVPVKKKGGREIYVRTGFDGPLGPPRRRITCPICGAAPSQDCKKSVVHP